MSRGLTESSVILIPSAVLLLVCRSMCHHSSLLPRCNLLETNSKIPRNGFAAPTFSCFGVNVLAIA